MELYKNLRVHYKCRAFHRLIDNNILIYTLTSKIKALDEYTQI